ncbi:BREX-3 system phosphatase PglZ [Bacillus sp. AFS017336]|uniref:BREX-3 system phosphatase PglZ n=1 Tax=Bacillus sp. AFS017336 TaxID=2033489 RepID=UPI000BF14E07|nr:BREX-3 system phosphatase PglZ [Bacillus sp. AFS017336]PEK99503.1 alkaline phosphatase [Bacillus sp. AFS017336]
MSNWREEIIKKIQYLDKHLVFVRDLDLLMDDENLIKLVSDLGYDVVRYEDSIYFRFFYEKELLEMNDTKLLVYSNDDVIFPYDLTITSAIITINMAIIFPKFSASILRKMNREELDALYTVHEQYQGSSNDYHTLEFIVKKLYKLPFEIVDSEVELFKVLLSMHYRNIEVPLVVKEFLHEIWKGISGFSILPLKQLIYSSSYFNKYIEDQWQQIVDDYSDISNNKIFEIPHKYVAHPFENNDVRRLMNDLFLDGTLSKVKFNNANILPKWSLYGIEINQDASIRQRLEFLHSKIIENLLVINTYKDWLVIVNLLSEYNNISVKLNDKDQDGLSQSLLSQVNETFHRWMLEQYQTLISLAPFPKPKMVHHIPHAICASKNNNEKIALIVLDGMSYFQWKVIKQTLMKFNFSFEENGVFAWVPTITSISRQAIFSGKLPLSFSNTLSTTASEEKQWKEFWDNQGILKQYVAYQKGLGKETYIKDNILALKRSSIKVYGAVVDIIDKLIHNAVLGEKGLESQLQLWLDSQYLVNLLLDLHKAGFTIYLTSDHGNTTCKGIGRISEGVLVDQRGERVRVYNDKTLYTTSRDKINSIPWTGIGLPKDYHVLLAKYGESFTTKGEEIFSHGGISIEETIVPFIKVQPK